MARAPRLIDLYVPWPRQYAAETTLFDATSYAEIPGRLDQLEGYLSATWAAVVVVDHTAAEWQRIEDRWRALADLIARVEAEFCGRLLIGPADGQRWRDDPDGLTWALLGVASLDFLVQTPADLDHLPGLFARGVRWFQAVREGARSRLNLDLLRVLSEFSEPAGGPRPLLDLSGLDQTEMDAVLSWFEAAPGRAERLIPVRSFGSLREEAFPSALQDRLRGLGGVIGVSPGLPYYEEPDGFRADLEARGGDAIAIGSAFLQLESTLPGLRNAGEVVGWLQAHFESAAALRWIQGNAASVMDRAVGRAVP